MDITHNGSLDSPLIHDVELERTMIVSLMVSGLNMPQVIDILTPDCFYDLKMQEIFCSILEVYNQGKMPDMILVGNNLAGKQSTITKTDIVELCCNTQALFDLREHALLLKEFALRRQLWEIGYKLMTKSSNQAENLEHLHLDAKENIDSLFEDSTSDLLTMNDTYKALQEEILLRKDLPPGAITGTKTGFDFIDKNGGLSSSDLIVVGAETSQGKTSFATALSLSAIENGKKVAFYSMEMTPRQLTARVASMKTGINPARIMNQPLTLDEVFRIDKAMESFQTENMFFDGKSTSSLEHILMSIRNMKMRHNIDGAVVDYIQMIGLGSKDSNAEQRAAECARKLKNIAKELDIWIIAISQFSRDNKNPLPAISRLRDSGQIEQAADNIYLIHRPQKGLKYPEPYDSIPTEGTAMVMVAKGRHVGTGEFICGFKPENTLFYPLNQEEIENLIRDHSLVVSYSNKGIDEDEPF